MKRVGILVETALGSGRAILAGIARFLHERDDWSVHHHTGPLGAMEPDSLDAWEGDGLIARLASPEVLARVQAKGVPVVDVLGNVPSSPYPLVRCDDGAIGRLVAEHFLEAGNRHFAFLGLSDERWSLDRGAAFAERLAGPSRWLDHWFLDPLDRSPGRWPEVLERVADWLEAAPKPLGLMVASDQFGPLVFEACHRRGLAMPEEVSIVGVDNDQTFCDLCSPRLSSVEPHHAAVGYTAARLLDAWLEGTPPPAAPVAVPPLTLHRRLSSDAAAVSDPGLVKALQCIRQRACEGVQVDAVARHAGLSRSVLQRRFRAQLGTTVGEALLRVKLRRACDMLALTDLPLLDVALRCGFNYQEYLTQVFRQRLGTTPARYRAQARHLEGHGR